MQADDESINEIPAEQRRFEELCSAASEYLDAPALELLQRAYTFAEQRHCGQKRKSGEAFIIHPVEVALILAGLHMDAETLAAALMHDTIEDTSATFDEVKDQFGESVAMLVEGVTKITRIEVESLSDEQAATIRKMLVAMSKDIRVIVIKLADRLHNMRTLASLREDRRIFKARETLEIYAPIAHRLGISSIKWELEDLAFFYLEPARYKQISRLISETRNEREEYLQQTLDILRNEMDKLGIEAQIAGRPKHLYSIYQKMCKKRKDFADIFDLIAVRIIVTTVKDCYSALGAVHTLWHPMPGRFKDYIAMPKFNMYQSLHTTVLGPAARPVEVQIRTEEMHQTSEYGVAAHWLYKEGNASERDKAFERQLVWLRQMIDWTDDTADSKEFLKDLKVDLDGEEVFVFTPKGEVKNLRAGSTPIDFAYAIHTEVGNKCVGAKVNGSIVPLSYCLNMGDRVEILTQKSARPSRGWLAMVKTPSARSKIRAYFSRISRSDDIAAGRDKLAHEMRKHSVGIANGAALRALSDVAAHMGYRDSEDLFVSLGTGKESLLAVSRRLLSELGLSQSDAVPALESAPGTTLPPMLTQVTRAASLAAPKRRMQGSSHGVVVKGFSNMLVRLSKCCNPVPGDDILGFITRGRGVSVHRSNCPNAKDLLSEPGRIIDVVWATTPDPSTSYKIDVHIVALDKMTILRDVAAVFSEEGASVLSSSSSRQKDGFIQMRFLFQLSDVSHVDDVLIKLLDVEGVLEARRMKAGEAVGTKKHHRAQEQVKAQRQA